MNSRLYFVISITILFQYSLHSQQIGLDFSDKIYDPNIKTVRFCRQGLELLEPIIELNGEDKLELVFDLLSTDQENYSYTILHYNSAGELSGLLESDYINGFYEAALRNYQFSFNTTYDYIHYKLAFPNEDMSAKISGNYLLVVYKNFDKEQVVFTRKFYVVQSEVLIDAVVKRPSIAKYYDIGQRMDLKINYRGYSIRDPYSEIKIKIIQNGNDNKSVRFEKPRFISNEVLDYTYDNEGIFEGGKEFMYFDIKSMRFQAEYIQNIQFENPYFHVYLASNEDRSFEPYFYIQDLDGNYYIDVQGARDKNIEADYVYVHFNFPMEVPLDNANVYIFGSLTDWNIDDNYKMEYNYNTHSYAAVILLKQGYYNYKLVKKSNELSSADYSFFEGNHYETENNYQIFVYHSDYVNRYEKLIAYKKISSLETMK